MSKILFHVVDELEKVETQQGIDLKKTYFLKTHPACAIDRKEELKTARGITNKNLKWDSFSGKRLLHSYSKQNSFRQANEFMNLVR